MTQTTGEATSTAALMPATGIDNSRMWLLVGAPLLLLAVDAGFLYSGRDESVVVSWAVALAVTITLAWWDSRYLRSRGVNVPALNAAWFVPTYLYRRSRVLGAGQAPLVLWLVAAGASVLGTILLGSHFVTLSRVGLESGIASWAEKNGMPGAVVSCPSRTVYAVHDTFVCSASDGSSTVQVEVTVMNSSGYVTWQSIGG